MKYDLKPCPFCGLDVRFDKAYSYFRDKVIYCDGCDMVFTLDDLSADESEIADAWNRRAQHERKLGRWEPLDDELDMAKCSECNESYIVNEKSSPELFMAFCQMYKFCPNCGVQMDTEERNAQKTQKTD